MKGWGLIGQRSIAFKIVAAYATLSALWISFTDIAVGKLAPSPSAVTLISTLKGWGFVVVTAWLLYELIRRTETALEEKTRQAETLQQESQEERGRLSALIDTAPVGISFHSAPEGWILLLNKAGESILGRAALSNLSLADQASYYQINLPSGESFPVEQLPASRSLRGETCVGVEAVIRQPSGREAFILMNSAPILSGSGPVVGAVVTYQDITAIREQERLRDEFLSAAAHELKTPITTIKGYAQLMRRWTAQGHEPREAQAMATIDAQCDRISRRVQEMLEAVRFRTSPAELKLVRFDLGELASEVARRLQSTTQSHRLLVEQEKPVSVEADREHIEEVLVSLLDNAIKFSPQGGTVEIKVRTQANEALVSVSDRGVGIAPERRDHIFEPFFEPVPAGAPGYRGVVALSLYLSKLTIERHRGRIWFESREGQGSTFHFTLPLAEAKPGDGQAA